MRMALDEMRIRMKNKKKSRVSWRDARTQAHRSPYVLPPYLLDIRVRFFIILRPHPGLRLPLATSFIHSLNDRGGGGGRERGGKGKGWGGDDATHQWGWSRRSLFPLQGMKLWEHIHGADMSTGGFGVERWGVWGWSGVAPCENLVITEAATNEGAGFSGCRSYLQRGAASALARAKRRPQFLT